MQNAAMLWTGGKDSSMVLYEAEQNGYCIRCLVTFVPPERRFLAHPLDFINMQAEALALPHHVLPVIPPFESGYETGLRRLQDEMGIDCVITGDISEVGGNPNWVGRELDDAALAELQRVREQAGLDLCGEEGEYHTLVIDGPSFTRAIDIRSHAVRTMASLAYMEIHHAELRERFI